MASARAYCRSPSRLLTSPDMRLLVLTYRYEGTAIAISTAAMTMTITSSKSVNPEVLRLYCMSGTLLKLTCAKLALMVSPWKTATCVTLNQGCGKPDLHDAPHLLRAAGNSE